MDVRAEFRAKMPQIEEICRRYHVRELMLFGSALRDDFRPDSDYDLLVDFEPDAPIGLIEFGNMEGELEDLLGRKVDLVPKRGLKPVIRENVLSSAEPVYAS
jgi:predicted nucleotidyltransferase